MTQPAKRLASTEGVTGPYKLLERHAGPLLRDGPQGNRILSCSGEHRQQVVFVQTTYKPFPSQPARLSLFLP